MSLISDALKTAQRQRTQQTAAAAGAPPFDGFFPYSQAKAPRVPRTAVLVAGIALASLIFGSAAYLRIRRLRPNSALAGRFSTLPPFAVGAPGHAAQLPVPNVVAAPAKPAVDPTVRQASVGYSKPHIVASVEVPRGKRLGSMDTSRLASRPMRSAPVVAPERASPAPVGDSAKPTAPPRVATAPRRGSDAASTGGGVQVTVESGGVRPVDALMTQALAAQRQGDLDRSKQLYDRAIKVGPASAALYNNYGALLTAMGDPSDAVAMLRLALTYDQAYVNAWVNLGNAQDALGDHTGAVAAFNQALRLDPTNRGSKVNLASQYVTIGAPREARRLLEAVIQSDPNYPTAHYVFAQALESDKDIPGAIREFTRFLELGGSPGNPGLDAKVRAHVNALKMAR